MPQIIPSETVAPSQRVQLAVASWLSEHSAAPLTTAAYAAELQRLIAELQRGGLAVDGDPGLVAVAARQIAARGGVRATTFNKRLATYSSFYRAAIRHGLITINPIDKIRRRRVRRYARSRALDVGDVRQRLAQIDRDTLPGQRDYALLSVALLTGRRRAELAALRWGHIERLSDGRARLTWAKVKASEDPLYDTLPPALSAVLLGYLAQAHGQLDALAPAAAVWVGLSNNRRGQPLTERAITDICMRRLNTTSVHRLRHTFAHTMDAKGATLTEIQRRLGHRSVATTAIYLQELAGDENRLAEDIERELGVG